ncbi:histidine phosphotransferase family protein [Kordiimonas aquimaris]|uniref:histidine phosphotransferase family protein n=1 Tax=Kordiimonas aquimaris TaxID=707591 RepID=UPI0021D1D2CD|nr:histidine phosphotransferase family protein [Kordiimonas aquimaris]
MSKLDFAALLCSRLCHDLVSPVGAINNGLELLSGEEDPNMREAVFDLIEKSTLQTSNKLQFFRLAFGAAGGFSAHLDTREAEKSLRAFLAGSKVDLDWNVTVAELSKGAVKLLLNLSLVGAEALIRGGELSVSFIAEGEDSLSLRMEASGERVILPDVVHAAVEGDIEEASLEPRAAPAYLAYAVAQELGGSIEVALAADTQLIVTSTIRSSV